MIGLEGDDGVTHLVLIAGNVDFQATVTIVVRTLGTRLGRLVELGQARRAAGGLVDGVVDATHFVRALRGRTVRDL